MPQLINALFAFAEQLPALPLPCEPVYAALCHSPANRCIARARHLLALPSPRYAMPPHIGGSPRHAAANRSPAPPCRRAAMLCKALANQSLSLPELRISLLRLRLSADSPSSDRHAPPLLRHVTRGFALPVPIWSMPSSAASMLCAALPLLIHSDPCHGLSMPCRCIAALSQLCPRRACTCNARAQLI